VELNRADEARAGDAMKTGREKGNTRSIKAHQGFSRLRKSRVDHCQEHGSFSTATLARPTDSERWAANHLALRRTTAVAGHHKMLRRCLQHNATHGGCRSA